MTALQQEQMMTTQTLSMETTTDLSLRCVFNPGNRYAKLHLENHGSVIAESGVLLIDDGEQDKRNLLINYQGRRPDHAIYTPWRISPHGRRPYEVVGNDRGRGKAIYALPLLIGLVWAKLPVEVERVSLDVAVLVHDPAGLKDAIRNAMQGSFNVIKAGRSIAFDITVSSVKREGSGIKRAIGDGSALAMDFGGNTLILQRWEGREIVRTPNAMPQSLCGYGSTGLVAHLQSEGTSLPDIGLSPTIERCYKFLETAQPTNETTAVLRTYLDNIDRTISRQYPGLSQEVGQRFALGGLLKSAVFKAAIVAHYPGINVMPSPQLADVNGIAESWYGAKRNK